MSGWVTRFLTRTCYPRCCVPEISTFFPHTSTVDVAIWRRECLFPCHTSMFIAAFSTASVNRNTDGSDDNEEEEEEEGSLIKLFRLGLWTVPFHWTIIHYLKLASQNENPSIGRICQDLLDHVNYSQLAMKAGVPCAPSGVTRKYWRWECAMHVTKQRYGGCWSKCEVHV